MRRTFILRGGLRPWIAAAFSVPMLPALAGPPAATQLPVGGQVVAGSASISQSNASMLINQTSNRAAIDWQSFNLGSQAQVTFQQPSSSSVTLNRTGLLVRMASDFPASCIWSSCCFTEQALIETFVG